MFVSRPAIPNPSVRHLRALGYGTAVIKPWPTGNWLRCAWSRHPPFSFADETFQQTSRRLPPRALVKPFATGGSVAIHVEEVAAVHSGSAVG